MSTPDTSHESKKDVNRQPNRGFEPTERQKQILEQIYTYGILTDKHVQWLERVGERRAQELMHPLFHNSFINRPAPKVRYQYNFMFYWLTRKGARLVADRLNVATTDLDWVRSPRWSQVDHDAYVNDFRIILNIACQKHPEFELLDWISESTFHSWQDQVNYVDVAGRPKKRRVAADGYGVIQRRLSESEDTFYSRILLEVEHAHKPNPRFAEQKILVGLAYLRSLIYEKRFGSKSGRFLFIVPTQEKLDNYRRAAQRVLNTKDYVPFYFTTFDQVSDESILFGPIWWRPGDKQPVALFKPDM